MKSHSINDTSIDNEKEEILLDNSTDNKIEINDHKDNNQYINDTSLHIEVNDEEKDKLILHNKEKEEELEEIKIKEIFTVVKGNLFSYQDKAQNKKKSRYPFLTKILSSNSYRWITIIIHLIFIFMTVYSSAFYILRKGNHNYILLCFELHDSIYLPLSTNSFAFLLILFIIDGLLIFVTNTLIRNDFKLVNPFFRNLSIASSVSLIFYSIQFTVGLLLLRSPTTLLFDLILSSISLLLLIFVYVTVKRKQYYKPKRILSESVYLSALLLFNCYVVIYLVFDMITRTPANLTQYTEFKFKMEVTFNLIMFGIALIVLTIYKDIIFPLLLEIIEIGLIAKTKKNGQTETFVTIFIIMFLYVGVVLMIFKHRISLFRYTEETELVIVNADNEKFVYS